MSEIIFERVTQRYGYILDLCAVVIVNRRAHRQGHVYSGRVWRQLTWKVSVILCACQCFYSHRVYIRHFGQLVPFWKVDIASSGQNSWYKLEFEMAKGEV